MGLPGGYPADGALIALYPLLLQEAKVVIGQAHSSMKCSWGFFSGKRER
jgi:hypothetical protein